MFVYVSKCMDGFGGIGAWWIGVGKRFDAKYVPCGEGGDAWWMGKRSSHSN